MKKEKISVVIITNNESKNIERCLISVAWADEKIVIDSYSTDDTAKKAKKLGAKVFLKKWNGFSSQKAYAIKKATNKWVISLDADEEVSIELKDEILNAIEKNEFDGFEICRKNFFLGKWIKRSGWFPDFQIRLFKKSETNVIDRPVHEGFIVNGKISRLKGYIFHYSYLTLEQYLSKQNYYTSLDVGNKLQSMYGKKIYWFNFILNPLSTFLRLYFVKGGWRDGMRGFILSSYSCLYTLLTYAKTWELQNAILKKDKLPPTKHTELSTMKELHF